MTETATPGDTATAALERRLELRAAPERVWRALSESSEIAGWFSQRADLPAIPGREGWLDRDGHGRVAIRVEVADPPHRLVWRWASEPDRPLDAQSTLVEWTLEPAFGGGTILTMRESGFAAPASRTGNSLGWIQELGELVAFVATEPWEAGIQRTYAFRSSPAEVWAAFADPTRFATWWGGAEPVELRAGAVGWWDWPSEGGRFAVRIEVVEPGVYLAWSWSTEPGVALEDAAQVLRTEWGFEPRDGGGTNLRLLETGFQGPKDHELNDRGWDGDVIPALRRELGEAPEGAAR